MGTVPGRRWFWFSPGLGWTNQLAYMLMHSVILSDTRVRHYLVTFGFDVWEPEDAIHTAPQRVCWCIWA